MKSSTKITVGALAGSIASIIMWGLSLKGITAPPGIETAIGTVVAVGVQLLLPNLPPDLPQ